jgi:gliding motility-associated protein GldE
LLLFTKNDLLYDNISGIFIQASIKPILLGSIPQTSVTAMLVLLLLLMVTSFIISGAEVAYFSLSFKDLNVLKTKQHPSARRILDMLDEPKSLLASLSIANTLLNIATIILANFLIDELTDVDSNFFFALMVKILVISSLLVLFVEVLPKVWAAQNNLRFAYYSSLLISSIHYMFRGISNWTVGYSDSIEKSLGGAKSSAYTLEELDQAIDLTTSKDATEEEKNMLKGIIKFGNITVKQVMRSRLDVHGVDSSLNFNEVVHRVEDLSYSRLPVYKENLDNVIGILHTKDIVPHLAEGPEFTWHKLIRTPYFVHEYKLIEDLLRDFQQKRIHFAIVVDEFGGTEGIVTLEDVMEEVIGDIRDEFDEEDSSSRKIDDQNFVFEGKAMIIDACRFMDLPVDTFDAVRGDSETLAGLVLEMAGEIPVAGQEIRQGDFLFKVTEVDKNRINKIHLTIIPS